jgi:hypothetical protein
LGVIWEKATAGVIVDADGDELPAYAATVALTGPITGNAMTDFVETTELFDIDVDHLAGSDTLITAHGLGRLQITYPVQSKPPHNAADGRRRHTGLNGKLLAGVALPQGLDQRACGSHCLAWQ